MRNFVCSPLKPDHVGRDGKNSRLPTIGVVLPNRHFHTPRPDLAVDHIGELRRTNITRSLRICEAPKV